MCVNKKKVSLSKKTKIVQFIKLFMFLEDLKDQEKNYI